MKNRGAVIPFHHQYILSELVTDVLSKCSKEYSDYEYYNFSGLKGQTKVARTGLCFYSSKVTLVFASPNEDLIRDFILSLFEREEIELGQLKLVPESVVKEEEVELKTTQSKFVCISPIVLMAPSLNLNTKKFISPETDVFSDLLYESTMNRMERSGRYTAEQISSFYKFQVVADKEYLHKIKSEEKKFARIYPTFEGGNKFEIRGYTMPFTLYAEPEVQQFIFDCGLGEVSHKGFGMLDMANTEPFKRVVNYEINTKVTSSVSH